MSATEGYASTPEGGAVLTVTITLNRHAMDYENIKHDINEALSKYGITISESGGAATESIGARATAKSGRTTRKRTSKAGRKLVSKSRKK